MTGLKTLDLENRKWSSEGRLSNPTTADRLLAKATDPTHDYVDPERAFDLGVRLAGEDRLAEAERAFAQADEGGHASGAFNLGVLLAHRGEVNSAEAAYRRADDRGLADAAFELGMLMAGQNRMADAEQAFARADQRGHAQAAVRLGMLLQDRGDLAGAADAYLRADSRGDAAGAFETGMLLVEKEQLAEAEEAFARAHARGHPNAAHNLAVLSEYRRSIAQEDAASIVGEPISGAAQASTEHAGAPPVGEPEAGGPHDALDKDEEAPAGGLASKLRRRRVAVVLVTLPIAIALVVAFAGNGAKSRSPSAATSASSAADTIALGTNPAPPVASGTKTPHHKTSARNPHAKPALAKARSTASTPARHGSRTASISATPVTTTPTTSGGASATTTPATATATATTTAPAPKPVNNSPAVISGTATVGQPLSSSAGAWSGAPTSYRYQWTRCMSSCSPIAGATSSSYTPTTADMGAKLAVVVSAANSSGNSSSQSAQVGPVMPGTDQVKAALAQAVAASDPRSAVAQLLRTNSYLTPFSSPSGGVLTIGWYLAQNAAPSTSLMPTLIAFARVPFHRAKETYVRITLTGVGRQMLGVSKILRLNAVGSFKVDGGITTSLTKAIRLQVG